MKAYYRDPAGMRRIRCTADVKALLVDPYGSIRSCFMKDPIGRVGEGLPRKIWKSERADEVRKEIATCPRPCRIMNRIY